MKSMYKLYIVLLILISQSLRAQDIERIEPPFWWTGMQGNHLQLMIYGPDISNTEITIEHKGIVIEKIHRTDNRNYLFVDLAINKNTEPGNFPLTFTYENKHRTKTYELREREDPASRKTIDQRDVIYLITPDRFVNGNTDNDEVEGLKEGLNRKFHSGRHGGDLDGILSKIGYLNDLGVTALWLNPVLENNMTEYSYHGYATTDYYKIDDRYGDNTLYRELADQLHTNGMKLIMDMIFNHCGSEHWWMEDMPSKDWFHYYPDFKTSNFSIPSLSDPYAVESDVDLMEKGWFVPTMPDLNHDNPLVTNYLIQNSIWWIEYAGLDGIRMDTYPFNKQEFMKTWTDRIYQEYPGFFIVGETWIDDVGTEAHWASKNPLTNEPFLSGVSSTTDFPLCFATHKAFGKEGDLKELHQILSRDFMYYNPSDNMIFLDNHDMDRFFYTIGEDIQKYKLALTFLLTTRGIPQIYYGSEILMKGSGEHGVIREDFPGGWKDDPRNAFTPEGRTPEENDVFDHLKKILNLRKNHSALVDGTLRHYIPQNNVYMYNRENDSESIVILINNSTRDQLMDLTELNAFFDNVTEVTDLLSDKKIPYMDTYVIKSNTSAILLLKKTFTQKKQ